MDSPALTPLHLNGRTIDLQCGAVTDGGGHTVTLRPQAAEVLKLLAARPGKLISKNEFIQSVWESIAVTDDSLVQCIKEIRKALGDENHKIVRTVLKRGYVLELARPESALWRRWTALASCVAGLAALAVGLFVLLTQLSEVPVDGRAPSIAVLPFEDLSGDERWARLGRGLAAEIASELARNRWLEVIAPASTETLGGTEPEGAAEQLEARFVIDGTLQVAVGQVRISARLTDAATRKVLWSERWARPEAELLQVQDDVLAGIGGSLGGALSGSIAKADLVQARQKPTESLDAYDHFLLGNDAKHRWTPEGFEKAAWHFGRAVEIDPEYAKAWALLSLTLIFQSETVSTEANRRKLWDEANAAAERGYALDPNDPDVLWRIARERASRGRFDSAQTELRRAVDLAPSNADVLMVSAWVGLYAGVRGVEPLQWARRAHLLTPVRPAKYSISLGLAAFAARDYELAAQILREAPPTNETLVHLAAAEALRGDIAAAKAVGARILAVHPNFLVDHLYGPTGVAKRPFLDDLERGVRLAGLPIDEVEVMLTR